MILANSALWRLIGYMSLAICHLISNVCLWNNNGARGWVSSTVGLAVGCSGCLGLRSALSVPHVPGHPTSICDKGVNLG